jgi:signal transduction histidine kinase/ActR/RegA family two-component response regulator
MRLSLHQKLSLGVCFLVAGLMASVMGIASFSVTRGIEGKIRKDLLAARKVFEELQALRVRQLLTGTKMLAEVPQIKAVVTTPGLDHATFLDSALTAQELIRSDLLLLSDRQGRLLASTEERERFGDDLAGEPVLAQALGGEEASGIRASEDGLYQVVALPFLLRDTVVGALLTGFAINRPFVESLETMTNCHVALLHPSRLETSAAGSALFQGLDLKASIGPEEAGQVFTRLMDGERYLLLKAPFGSSEVFYVLARSLDKELAFYRLLQRGLFLVAAAVLLVALVLVTGYAGRITRPIQALAAEARRIATGDLESRFVSSSSDEIGDLARAFNRMIGELKQSRDELVQAQKMEAIGRLAGGVAHDFNNLLTAILGYCELLLLKPWDPARRKRYIEQISATGVRAAGLTRQLLAFSRRQVLQPQVLDLNRLILDLQSMLRRLIGEDVELAVLAGPAPARVKADPIQIEQVVMNLAVNARDAMPRGGRLTIETGQAELDPGEAPQHRMVKPGPHVLLAVSDTGVGMDPETRSHIFEPFFTTKGERGTGLGLSTVYGIVQQSGGHIRVFSEPGRGTRFEVLLPRAEEEEEAGPAEPAPVELRPRRGEETVLIAEDEEVVRTLAGESLRENGYTVLEARHGIEALALCEKHEGPIHLLLTDVVMPLMGGGELAERLARLRPELRVIYMSGYTDETIGGQGLPRSGEAFLQKPFTSQALALKVREVLEGSEA